MTYDHDSLRRFLDDALIQEEVIGEKLETVQALMEALKDAAKQSWTSLITEDDLLSKIVRIESELVAKAGDDGAKEMNNR